MNRPRYKNMIGYRNGRLLVESLSHLDSGQTAIWNCKCDCGYFVKVHGASLRRTTKSTKSCGCLQREEASKVALNNIPKRLTMEEWKYKELLHHYKLSGSARNLKFNLSIDFMINISKQNCTYCGTPPINIIRHSNKIWKLVYQGIDRVDSAIPYEEYNCVPCCKHCNRAKHSMSSNAFLMLIKKIYEFNKGFYNE